MYWMMTNLLVQNRILSAVCLLWMQLRPLYRHVRRQEIQTALGPVETSLTNTGERFGVRIRTLESQVAKQSTPLEGLMAANGPGTTTLCELDDKLAELKSQTDSLTQTNRMQQGPVPNMSGLAKTMVASGWGGLGFAGKDQNSWTKSWQNRMPHDQWKHT